MRTMLRVLIVIALVCLAAPAAAGTPGRFIQYPDIHGNTIVFNWEYDLWMVPAGGGTATRLTNHPGGENVPKFSPDGKQIAFTGQYEGPNLYVIPAAGGVPVRVSYMGPLQPVAWTPDGTRIVVRSGHENTFRPDSVTELTRAAQLAPEEARFAYVLGVALHDTGNPTGARRVLEDAERRHPGDRDILEALVSYTEEAGDISAAIGWARRIVAMAPGDMEAAQRLAALQGRPRR